MADAVTAEEIRDAFLLLNSRVGYTTEGDQRAVETAITGWFVDPPLAAPPVDAAPSNEVALRDNNSEVAPKDDRPLTQRNRVGDSA